MNLSQALLHALQDHGAREIFGIPGDFVLAFFRQIETTGILPMYTLSHEPAVGFAAVTYGAGALNMVNAVASSYAEKVPLVVISGAPGAAERTSGYLLHHQAKTLDSQLAIFREITCDQVVLDDPARAPQDLARLLHNCLAQSRPVYIELPRDVVDAPCARAPRLTAPCVQPDTLAACAAAVLARLPRRHPRPTGRSAGRSPWPARQVRADRGDDPARYRLRYPRPLCRRRTPPAAARPSCGCGGAARARTCPLTPDT